MRRRTRSHWRDDIRRWWRDTHAAPLTTCSRNRPARRGARASAPAARTKLTATSSRLVLFAPPRLIILVLPDVSFFNHRRGKGSPLAVRGSPARRLDPHLAPAGAVPRYLACFRTSADTRGNSRIPGAASRSSGRRNRSQTIDSGFHSRTSETRSPTSGTRRPVATRSTPAETRPRVRVGRDAVPPLLFHDGRQPRRDCDPIHTARFSRSPLPYSTSVRPPGQARPAAGRHAPALAARTPAPNPWLSATRAIRRPSGRFNRYDINRARSRESPRAASRSSKQLRPEFRRYLRQRIGVTDRRPLVPPLGDHPVALARTSGPDDPAAINSGHHPASAGGTVPI